MTADTIEYKSVTRRIGPMPIWTVTQSLWKLKESSKKAFTVEANLSIPIKESSGKKRERHAVYYREVRTDSPPAFGNTK